MLLFPPSESLPGIKNPSVPLFSLFISTTHLCSLAPRKKNCTGTLKAHLWPGASMLLESRDVSQLLAEKSRSSFVRRRQKCQYWICESHWTPSPRLPFLRVQRTLARSPTASAGGEEGSRRVSLPGQRAQTNSCSNFWWFHCHILHALYISSTKSMMTGTIHFWLPINRFSSSLFNMILCFCFMSLSPLPHLKFSTDFI